MKRPDENIAQRELREVIGRGRRSVLRQGIAIDESTRLSVHTRCVGTETTKVGGKKREAWIFSDGSVLSRGADGWNASERLPSHAEQWLALKADHWTKYVAAAAVKNAEWSGDQGSMLRFHDGSAILDKGDGWTLVNRDRRRLLPPGEPASAWLGVWKNEMRWAKPPDKLMAKAGDAADAVAARWLAAIDQAGRSLIERALAIAGLDLQTCYCAASSSFYLIFDAKGKEDRCTVRLSGHHQRLGGGWNIGKEQRMGSANIDIVLLDGNGTFAEDQEGPLDLERALAALSSFAGTSPDTPTAQPAPAPRRQPRLRANPRTTTVKPQIPKRRYL